MKKERIEQLIKEGYALKVCLRPDKKHTKMCLKTELSNGEYCFDVYHNHAKVFLSEDQINFIETYREATSLSFGQLVDLNVRKKRNTATESDFRLLVMNEHIRKMKYLEQA